MRSLRYLDNSVKKAEPSKLYEYINYFFEFMLLLMFFVMIFLVLLLAPEIEQTIIEWKKAQ